MGCPECNCLLTKLIWYPIYQCSRCATRFNVATGEAIPPPAWTTLTNTSRDESEPPPCRLTT